MKIIHVEKKVIPYSADIRVAGTTYTFTFNYNAEGDFFTVDLARSDRGDEVLALGEKITLGRALFVSYVDERFPLLPIIPIDLSMQVEKVGWKELGESVFLYVVSDKETEAVVNE